MSIDKALAHLDAHRDEFIDRLFDLLRIPSVSTLPENKPDMQRAAEWCAGLLRRNGLETRVMPTDTHPAVVGRHEGANSARTLMLYGHYDVQPAGDESLWQSPPFEPTIRDGAVFARGAADDKGQALANLLALECWQQGAGSLPVNVVVLIEGEEEIGSPSFASFLDAHAAELACDDVLVSDSAQYARGMPAITYSLRGLVYKQIEITGPNRDLHSGVYGGVAPNPANILCDLIASMKDASGRVVIPGFYDGVLPLEDWERKNLASLPYDEAAVARQIGVPRLGGETDYRPLERVWARPTLDVNGIVGGFTGPGSSTIIPSKAMAKVSMRLVPHQDPTAVATAFDRFVAERLDGRCEYRIHDLAHCGAYLAPVDGPGVQAARDAVQAAWGTQPVLIREGGTLPILATIRDRLGADSTLVGYSLPDCPVHGPNEFLHIDDFLAGIRTGIHFLARYAELSQPGR